MTYHAPGVDRSKTVIATGVGLFFNFGGIFLIYMAGFFALAGLACVVLFLNAHAWLWIIVLVLVTGLVCLFGPGFVRGWREGVAESEARRR